MSGGCCLRIFVPSTKVATDLVKLVKNTTIHYNHERFIRVVINYALFYFDRTGDNGMIWIPLFGENVN